MNNTPTGSAKPSNLRAKFENFAKIKEEEDLRRTAEQKRIREEKDRLDREQAVKGEITRNSTTNSGENGKGTEQIVKPQRKGYVDTGRSGGIGSARDMFNKAQSPEEAPVIQRVCFDCSRTMPMPFHINNKLHSIFRRSQSNCQRMR